ncbi:MAG: TrbI/VirB10 family protein [Sphingobium sp.]|nr:TrbI/VirB10 family protein [Sphingobium sp.]MBP9157595.1 TrbI/VirB10 family protein [Sphingobium sp.]
MSEESDGATAAPAPAEAFQLRGNPPRVMRLSRKALAGLGIAAGLGIGGSLIYALKPTAPHQAAELYNTDSRAQADAVTAAPKDYSQVPKLGPPLPGDLGRPILSAQERGANVPVPPGGTQPPQSNPQANAAEQARQHAAQERDAARTSRLFLGGGTVEAAQASAGASPPVALATEPATPPPIGQAAKRAFLKTQGDGRFESASRLNTPSSPNVVQAGSIIPAALITGIRSDLPGQITAQVTQNVYDSPTGRILLIPQGARLIGEYDSEISFGQNRVLLAWDRMILPDGRSIALERQPGADASGMAGLQDKVNQHWGGVFKAALISTVLGNGTELASNNDDDLVRALRRGSQDTINQAGQQIVQRQLNVQPTLSIRPGYPLRVIVTRDLILEPIGGAK